MHSTTTTTTTVVIKLHIIAGGNAFVAFFGDDDSTNNEQYFSHHRAQLRRANNWILTNLSQSISSLCGHDDAMMVIRLGALDSFVWKRNIFLSVILVQERMETKPIVDNQPLKGIWQLNYAKTWSTSDGTSKMETEDESLQQINWIGLWIVGNKQHDPYFQWMKKYDSRKHIWDIHPSPVTI